MRWRRSFVATTSPRAHRTRFMRAPSCCRFRHPGQHRDKYENYRVPLRFVAETPQQSLQSCVIEIAAISVPITMQTLCN